MWACNFINVEVLEFNVHETCRWMNRVTLGGEWKPNHLRRSWICPGNGSALANACIQGTVGLETE